MTLARLYYLTCGAPAGGEHDLATTPREARATATSYGWTHRDGRDHCPIHSDGR